VKDRDGAVEHRYNHTADGTPFTQVVAHPRVRGVAGMLVDRLAAILAELAATGEGPIPTASPGVAQAFPPVRPAEAASAHAGTPLSKEAKALAALVDHPEWNDAQIAEAAGCHVKSLYRMPKFVSAKALLRAGKDQLPTGSKDKDDGSVEAWDEDDE
jgi:hypothetical protein